ncbi:MAG: zinc ribbon domain-containing protein [Bacteroidaceae bacterium]|nr:zinc ribbon domain-containing protein [Bacteroidaceae bacterium]
MRKVCLFLMTLVLLTACYYPADEMTLYAVNDNFYLTADSMWLQTQEPLHNMPIDTLSDSVVLYYDDPLVVAQIVVIPEDSIDSIWVKVARDQFTQGWIHQNTFLSSVVPDDPISEFIYLFSQRHLWYFLGVVFIVLVVIVWRQIRHSHFHVIFVRDISSFYPTLLAVTLSSSAILYASIQRLVPETWVMYYYHPTLNPFDLPLILGLFIASIWLLVVLIIATIDEVFTLLPIPEAILYLFSLLGVCVVCYLVFSQAVLGWVGYILFVLLSVALICRYFRFFRARYVCGNCGAKMHSKGRCTRCKTLNV